MCASLLPLLIPRVRVYYIIIIIIIIITSIVSAFGFWFGEIARDARALLFPPSSTRLEGILRNTSLFI